jgi:protein tyrosine/serine phosphatase
MGKDRTGLIFAILLSLAGVSDGAIASEYSLSEVSLKSTLHRITAGIQTVSSPPISDLEAQKRAELVIQARSVTMSSI